MTDLINCDDPNEVCTVGHGGRTKSDTRRATRRLFLTGGALGLTALASRTMAQELTRSQLFQVGPAMIDADYLEQVEISKDAYIWGYPLVNIGAFFNIHKRFDLPLNRWLVGRGKVIDNAYAPNIELLYGLLYMDVSDGPQILTVPDTNGRYYSLQFLDPYSNILTYLSKRTTNTKAGVYAVVGPDWKGKLPQGIMRISAPYNRVIGIARTFVAGPDDIEAANAVQDAYRMGTLSTYPNELTSSETISISLMVQLQPMLRYESYGPQYFDLLGQQLALFPPDPKDAARLERYAKIGIGPGLRPSLTQDARKLQVMRDGVRLGEAAIVGSDPFRHVNGWSVIDGTGLVTKNPVLRAFINRWGTGFHIAEEGLYFMRDTGPEKRPLTGANKYRLRFAPGQLPPVDAFWTLSVMKPNSMQIANPINRYSIASNTPGLVFGADGSLEILIQRVQPAEGIANWLPCGNDPFRLTLRLYQPKEIAATGGYNPPQLHIV